MKQVLLKKGRIVTADVPPPQVQPGMVLVDVRASCISPGTEMMGLAASAKSLLQRAWEQPDKARAALAQMRRSGVRAVLRRAREKQDTPRAQGYSAAGVVLEVGEGAEAFQAGDRVAVAGATCAYHAERVVVPVNLAARIPDGVGFAEASSVALGAIAMQGVRRANLQLGEFVAVIGCGALGLLTVQMLRAAGCRPLALDLNTERLELAAVLGAELTTNAADENAVKRVVQYCNGHGADAVIITAATDSNEPLLQAFQMARRKGRVVLVGVVGKEFSREEMYAKELDFVISTSYGPGRYDDDYERFGLDYPYAYVRWTERRNMAAYLDLIARGGVRLDRLIGARFPVDRADEAFEALKSPRRPLLAVLEYQPGPAAKEPLPRAETVAVPWVPPTGNCIGVAIVGAGGFVRGTHLPNLKALADRYALRWVVDQNGVAAQGVAAGLPGCRATTDLAEALQSPEVQMVLIGTRHDTHADLAIRSLRAGKAVLVEKPMCLTPGEFEDLRRALDETQAPFTVGYNRRFSPHARAVRRLVERRINPLMIHYTMNAGYIPYNHWTQTAEGGGRIVGEGCHILDLFRYLVGHPAESLSVDTLRPATDAVRASDNRVITVRYADGSVCTLLYTATGHTGYAKEHLGAFFDERTLILDDYLTLTGYGCRPEVGTLKTVDKGHRAELEAFHAAIASGARFSIPREELEETWWLTWQAHLNSAPGACS